MLTSAKPGRTAARYSRAEIATESLSEFSVPLLPNTHIEGGLHRRPTAVAHGGPKPSGAGVFSLRRPAFDLYSQADPPGAMEKGRQRPFLLEPRRQAHARRLEGRPYVGGRITTRIVL